MAKKPLLECASLIPTRRDRNLADGEAHKTRAWKWLHGRLLDFGGATRDLDSKGGWYLDPDTGEPVMDLARKYTIALTREEIGELRAVLHQAAAVFAQTCIYLSIARRVEFVKGPRHETG